MKEKELIDHGLAPTSKSAKDIDIWRDTPLRYLGYANEVGEAFGPLYPKYVRPSYAVAFLYVGCDTGDKFIKSLRSGESAKETFQKTSDALIWQTLASVLIPGKIIHLVANGSTIACNTSYAQSLPKTFRLYAPTVIGLATIPFIIHPIDHAVDYFMDSTYRKLFSWLEGKKSSYLKKEEYMFFCISSIIMWETSMISNSQKIMEVYKVENSLWRTSSGIHFNPTALTSSLWQMYCMNICDLKLLSTNILSFLYASHSRCQLLFW